MSAPGFNGTGAAGTDPAAPAGTRPPSYRVSPDRAALLLVARTNAGPITFGTTGIEGLIEAATDESGLQLQVPPVARLDVRVDELRSGNDLYDAELRRRVDVRRFPTAKLELRNAKPVGSTGFYHVEGELTFHGVTRPMTGAVAVSFPEPGRMIIDGEQLIDMRNFEIEPPAVAMLRIYPEVRVKLHLEADCEEA